ncbi:hypothetical protein AAG906_002342 [Vitis piasezkii]|uniref:FLZ-type domain-containing protein n=2 Tax=Vitis vinifera TaxID=29760 RepID=A0ABY9CA09_VITVI|nr:FCS-Like Zinc finger 6 [Vitis vinifera]RVX23615.1 hypothetical protein CK203_000319 [Vitis vinifera]WJZ91569.1 hypothetical protein VitviT2T_010630 [Vitis vinifera]|eukprot:XP_003635265.2 PREDICTED: uncharacterized protein LOC100853335 [Vitis vinifera]
MMLGKRARPQIKRTTSMTGITVDLGHVEAPAPADPQNPIKDVHAAARVENMVAGSNGYDPRFLAATVSPRIHRRSSGEFMETAHFLRTCGLCQRRLQPGRDIYMYRGDTAFCSLECREQQMKQDERKEKYSGMASKKEDHRHHASAQTAAASEGETLAAA